MKKKLTKTKENYIDNKKFLEEIIIYKKKVAEAETNGAPPPQLNRYLGECLLKIAQRMAYRPEFINYSFVEEMVLDSIENMCQYFNNFDPERIGPRSGIVTPFGYFSQIAYYAFQRRIMKEEKQRYTKYKMMENVFISVDGAILEDYNPSSNPKFADTVNTFMAKYEKRERDKKTKREEKKAAANASIEKPENTTGNN